MQAPRTGRTPETLRCFMDARHDALRVTKWTMLIDEHLRNNGIYSIEDAPDELIDEAHRAADKILGEGKDD